MRPNTFASITLTSIMISACSIYPLPQDATGYNTYQIVANIRCEARDGLRASTITYLKQFDGKITRDGLTGSELAAMLTANPAEFETYKITNLIGEAKEPFNYYKNSQIAYEFSLRGVGSNTQGVDLGLSRSFGLRRDTLGFKAEALRSRDVTRSFFVWDKFEDLVRVTDAYCAMGKPVNIVYPSTGGLPIYDLIYNYIEANELGILTSRSGKNSVPTIQGTKDAPAIPAMGDTIIFRTRLDGNITPNVNFNPLGSGLLVSSIAIKDDNYREDTHTLTITVSTAPDRKKKSPLLKQPDIVDASDGARLRAAQTSIEFQRGRRFENAIINLSNSLSRLAQ